jgi:anti-sigma regulatory factor (Ser/Thr protein kinase)
VSTSDQFLVDPLVETYPAVADSVPLARRALARLASACGAAADQIDAVRLAVSEAMTNAVVQGSGTGGGIRVRAAVAEDGLAVSIDDNLSWIRPGPAEPNLGPGLGLALIAHATDELAIAKRPSGGTELRMRFALADVSPRT